jgi:hypothetical protein
MGAFLTAFMIGLIILIFIGMFCAFAYFDPDL